MSQKTYQQRKVAILGLSTEGLDAAIFFSQRGADVYCCDRRTAAELGNFYAQAKKYGVTFRLGKEYLSHLEQYDLVIRTPGMALFLPELRQLKKPVSSLTNVFLSECRAPIIGVTGTKGKGTTSTLIYKMLQQAGKHAYIGGNIGTPLLSQVDDIAPDAWVILELSSFQLEDARISPHISVVLRITQEHLANFDPLASNYHANRQDYVQAKTAIVRFQKAEDFIICNADDQTSTSFAKLTPANPLYFSRYGKGDAFVQNHAVYFRMSGKLEKICSRDDIQLIGEHNLENIAAATLAAYQAGASLDAIRQTAKTFAGLEHRLEKVATVAGVTYINDTFSTVPETTIAAIESFSQPIILIAGGSEKKSDFTELGVAIARSSVKTLILIGQMADRIRQATEAAGYQGEYVTGLRTMEEIVHVAKHKAQPEDIVLLSPACASFDMFKNYKQRGELFKTYAITLKQSS